MTMFSPAALLALWEHGASLHPIDRTLALCRAARANVPPAQLADLPLGQVNTALLELRRANYGPRLAAQIDCVRCTTRLELSLDLDAVISGLQARDSGDRADAAGSGMRAPTLRDLAAVAQAPNPDIAARMLLERCGGEERARAMPSSWDAERSIETLDPAADIALALTCEECGHQWSASLDVGALLWEEISACALALIDDVHRLAAAYGWAEHEILALGAARRAAYLERCAG